MPILTCALWGRSDTTDWSSRWLKLRRRGACGPNQLRNQLWLHPRAQEPLAHGPPGAPHREAFHQFIHSVLVCNLHKLGQKPTSLCRSDLKYKC